MNRHSVLSLVAGGLLALASSACGSDTPASLTLKLVGASTGASTAAIVASNTASSGTNSSSAAKDDSPTSVEVTVTNVTVDTGCHSPGGRGGNRGGGGGGDMANGCEGGGGGSGTSSGASQQCSGTETVSNQPQTMNLLDGFNPLTLGAIQAEQTGLGRMVAHLKTDAVSTTGFTRIPGAVKDGQGNTCDLFIPSSVASQGLAVHGLSSAAGASTGSLTFKVTLDSFTKAASTSGCAYTGTPTISVASNSGY